MMTEEERIEWLLEFLDEPSGKAERQGHPEQLTDEQVQQILADDEMRRLVQQLGFAKHAFKHDALKNDTPDVEAEWEQFASTHAELLDALDEEKPKRRFHASLFTHKIAASIIGGLLASGITFAAIHVVRNIITSKPQPSTTEQLSDIKTAAALPADTVKADTISTRPYVFNNVPLDSMLTTIAAAHGLGVEFENEATRQLRFHFVWKREDSLMRVVGKLNTFEAVNIGIEGKKMVVR